MESGLLNLSPGEPFITLNYLVTRISPALTGARWQGKWEGYRASVDYAWNAYGSYAGPEGRSAYQLLSEQSAEKPASQAPRGPTRDAGAYFAALDRVEVAEQPSHAIEEGSHGRRRRGARSNVGRAACASPSSSRNNRSILFGMSR